MSELGEKKSITSIKTESESLAKTYENKCRLCLDILHYEESDNNAINLIHSCIEAKFTYSQLAMDLTEIEILENDCLPKRICEECRQKLELFLKFKRKCESTDKLLRETFYSQNKYNVQQLHELKEEESENESMQFVTAIIDENNLDDKSIELKDETSEDIMYEKDIKKDCTAKKKHGFSSSAPKPKLKERTRTVCEQCGLTFSSNCTLQRHSVVHSGVKNYVCSICCNRFARKFHLDMHMRVHLKIRPHICEECGRGFSTSSDLSRHRRIHTDQKNYSCVICDRRFKRSSDVTKHMRSHTGQKPYCCKPCDKKYSSHSGISKHLRRHHPDVVKSKLDEANKKKAKEQELVMHFTSKRSESELSGG